MIERYVIVIWVSGGYGRPYKAPTEVTVKHSPRQYYIRKFANTVVASSEEEKELFYASSSIPFDDRPNLAADISDLDIGLMCSHLKEINSNPYPYSLSMNALEIAKDMQLIDGPKENLKPLNVGILMFSENPQKYFRYARIEIVDIPDPTGTNMIEKIFTGPIQRQLKDALQYLKNYVLKEVVIKTQHEAEAIRISNYPYAAIEEILSNAVYHRSYQINEPITVRITPQSIEMRFPCFDCNEATKKDDIRARIYRNRRIGDFLKELKLIEGRNTGFLNARKALMENGSPNLQFEMNEERDYLSVIIPIHDYFSKKDRENKNAKYEEEILKQLQNTPLTLTELSHALGYKGITAKLKKAVDTLILKNRITQVVESKTIKLKRL